MNCLRYGAVIGAILATAACSETAPTPTDSDATMGTIELAVPASPGDVMAIHVSVTGPDYNGSIDTDLVEQPDHSWLGTALDVPPGTGRTMTAEGFDADQNNTYEGITTGVTVYAGSIEQIGITMKALSDDGGLGADTPPDFVDLQFPDSITSTQTANVLASADDPDPDTMLTYTWSILQGGGSLTFVGGLELPGNPVSNTYTPDLGFDGFAVIQVDVSDGTETTTTTFPIAVTGV